MPGIPPQQQGGGRLPPQPPPGRRSRKGLLIGLVAGVAAVAMAGTAAIGLTIVRSDDSDSSDADAFQDAWASYATAGVAAT